MKNIFILLISITTLFACSSSDVVDDIIDDGPQPKELTGKYVMTDGPFNRRTTVYIDDSNISFLSEQDDYGTRTRSDWEYEVLSDTEINIDAAYTVSWNGNKLTLDSGDTKYVLIKDADAPTAEQWVTTIELATKIQQSTFVKNGWKVSDLTIFNGSVYTSSHQNLNGDNVLTKIKLSDFSTTEIPIPNASKTSLGRNDNIAYVGSNKFWVYGAGSSTEHMYEFNTNTLDETNRIPVPKQTENIYHMASNGTELYGSFYDKLKKWNFVEQKWDNHGLELGGRNLDGLAIDDDYLYISGHGIIHKYSLSPFKAVAAYDISMGDKYSLYGMTLTSKNHIVASAYNYDTKDYEIATITLP